MRIARIAAVGLSLAAGAAGALLVSRTGRRARRRHAQERDASGRGGRQRRFLELPARGPARNRQLSAGFSRTPRPGISFPWNAPASRC